MMRWPDFLIIGAAKAGTTALYHYLRQHPDIFVSAVREPNYFGLDRSPVSFCGPGDQETIGLNSISEQAAYLRLFEGASEAQQAGEVSPLYLYSPSAASRIYEANREAKLIVMLRHPVDRAYASYLHLVRDGREPLPSFETALEAEATRIEAGWEHLWHYRSMGFYGVQLARYLSFFDRSQLLVVLHEEFKQAPETILKACFSFLDVDPFFKPDMSRRPNQSGIPRSKWVQRLLQHTGPVKQQVVQRLPERWRGAAVTRIQRLNLRRPSMSVKTRRVLQEAYQVDIERLQGLIDRDLAKWLIQN